MMGDNCLTCDVRAGTVITAEMVQKPADSLLWRIRQEMEKAFAIRR